MSTASTRTLAHAHTRTRAHARTHSVLQRVSVVGPFPAGARVAAAPLGIFLRGVRPFLPLLSIHWRPPLEWTEGLGWFDFGYYEARGRAGNHSLPLRGGFGRGFGTRATVGFEVPRPSRRGDTVLVQTSDDVCVVVSVCVRVDLCSAKLTERYIVPTACRRGLLAARVFDARGFG